MKEFNKIKNIIQIYGLRPATQRRLPLLTLSCIARGYTLLLREALGFSYEAIGAIGEKGKFHTLLNEDHVAKETGNFVEKNKKKIKESVFLKAREIYSESLSKVEMLNNSLFKTNPQECLRTMLGFYPEYMLGIGIYNCFLRYVGNDASRSELLPDHIERISIDRDKIAKIYPHVEDLLKKACQIIGEQRNIDGDLLRYFTLDEINCFLKDGKLTKKTVRELALRRDGYLYAYIENKSEEIILDRTTIRKIKEQSFLPETDVKEIKGFVVFRGDVEGRVYNLQNHDLSEGDTLKGGDILVASMTHPRDIMLIKKSGGIITDEGGLLCHAAVVSRELKKPCIIGTKIATKILGDEDIVSIDGDNATVRILKRKYEKF